MMKSDVSELIANLRVLIDLDEDNWRLSQDLVRQQVNLLYEWDKSQQPSVGAGSLLRETFGDSTMELARPTYTPYGPTEGVTATLDSVDYEECASHPDFTNKYWILTDDKTTE